MASVISTSKASHRPRCSPTSRRSHVPNRHSSRHQNATTTACPARQCRRSCDTCMDRYVPLVRACPNTLGPPAVAIAHRRPSENPRCHSTNARPFLVPHCHFGPPTRDDGPLKPNRINPHCIRDALYGLVHNSRYTEPANTASSRHICGDGEYLVQEKVRKGDIHKTTSGAITDDHPHSSFVGRSCRTQGVRRRYSPSDTPQTSPPRPRHTSEASLACRVSAATARVAEPSTGRQVVPRSAVTYNPASVATST